MTWPLTYGRRGFPDPAWFAAGRIFGFRAEFAAFYVRRELFVAVMSCGKRGSGAPAASGRGFDTRLGRLTRHALYR